MFSTACLENTLSPLGFFLAFEVATEAWFVRANTQTGLFEILDLNAGKSISSANPNPQDSQWGDTAFAGIRIALTPGRHTSLKAMSQWVALTDWTNTKSDDEAAAWEHSVVTTVSGGLESLSLAESDELLARTADARSAVSRYLELLDRRRSVAEWVAELTRLATEAERLEAQRLVGSMLSLGLRERAFYDLAALLIVLHAESIEGNRDRFWGKSAFEVPELKCRLHLLASRLYPEHGWELMDSGLAATI